MDRPQSQYWMWSKDQKHILNRKNQDESVTGKSGSCDQDLSWEEQAFAEDAAGPLGGCIWPPRSYSCSFCRREFKSAQALGGHMNVHRRDRARLKLSNNENCQNHVIQYPPTSFDLQYPTASTDHQGSNPIVYNPNPTQFHTRVSIPPTNETTTSQSHTRVSTPPTNETTTFFQGNYDTKSHDLSSTNLCLYRKCPTLSDNKVEESLCSKRKRTNEEESILIPFFDNQNIAKKLRSSSEIELHQLLELSPSSTEDVDLELRLGDPPQVM